MFVLDEVIRPLSAPDNHHQPSAIFVMGEEEGESKDESTQPSFPQTLRSLDDCLAIFRNPKV